MSGIMWMVKCPHCLVKHPPEYACGRANKNDAPPETPPVSDNPKNLAARKRLKIAYLPAAGIIHGAHACGFGADKYNPYNWRDKKIALMEYASAIQRHLLCWIDGEDDSPGEAHHLGHVIAGAAIMLDAIEQGLAIDDRPKKGNAAELLARLTAKVKP